MSLERRVRHRVDVWKDKASAGRLNNVFASVSTLENRTVEKTEEKFYYVREKPSSNRDIKGSQEPMVL